MEYTYNVAYTVYMCNRNHKGDSLLKVNRERITISWVQHRLEKQWIILNLIDNYWGESYFNVSFKVLFYFQ